MARPSGIWGETRVQERAVIHISAKLIIVWVAIFLAAGWISAQGQSPTPPHEIEFASEFSSLGNEAARSQPLIHLHAQALYVDIEWGMLVVRDASGTAFLTINKHSPPLQSGDILDITGRVVPASGAPIITDMKIRALGRAQVSAPPKVSMASLGAAKFNGQFIETEGTLQAHPPEYDRVSYTLVDGPFKVQIIIPSSNASALANILEARVSVRAVKGAYTDPKTGAASFRLWVPEISDVMLEDQEWHGPFALPVIHIGQIQAPANASQANRPVHVKGTLVWAGVTGVVLANGPSSIYAELGDHLDGPIGSEIEIVGFPEQHDGTVYLRDCLMGKPGSVVLDLGRPREISPHTASLNSYAGTAVRISGRLVGQSTVGKDYLFTLDRDGVPIKLLIPGTAPKEQFLTISPGTEVECRGVLRLQPQKTGPPQIEILANSPSDLLVKTGLRTNWKLFIAILLVLVAIGVVLWIVQMRRALHVNTIQIRSQLEHEAQIESQYRRLFERNLAGVFTWNPLGEILDCNLAFARMVGYDEPAKVIGKSYCSFNTDLASCSLEAILGRGTRAQETEVKKADGSLVYLLEHTTYVDSPGAPYLETMALDISESRRAKLALQNARDAAHRESLRDALTGLPNRRHFIQAIKEELEASDNATSAVAVLFIDLNGFKAVNDTLGHNAGDEVLREVASRMAAELGSRGTLCRMGGDEFAVILRYCDTSSSPVQIAESLQACMIQPFPASGTQVAVSASIGISSYPQTASDDTTLLRQADSAMYIAKRSGANVVVVYTPDVGSEREEHNQLLTELKMAVARGEIHLEYQPEYELQTGQLMRFEALARWTSPVLGKVPPNKFIPVAEESGMMIDIGAHILEMACRDAVAWNAASGQRIPVAVNVSSIQLRGESFVESVLEIARRTGLDPTLLELEMTESITLNSHERAVGILTELRNAGVKLALDDFGTGYSSLSYLGDLPFDRLKIDRSFLRKADLGHGVPALLNAVLSVAHALSMAVVVEGVETVEELEFVTLIGADEVQGFLTGRPSSDPQRVIAEETIFATRVTAPAKAPRRIA